MKYRVEITERSLSAYIVEADSRKDAEDVAVSDHEHRRLCRVWFDTSEREVRVNQPSLRLAEREA